MPEKVKAVKLPTGEDGATTVDEEAEKEADNVNKRE